MKHERLYRSTRHSGQHSFTDNRIRPSWPHGLRQNTMSSFVLRCCCLTVLIGLGCTALFGCSTGKKNILFITKTSLGVDIDSKPPTMDVAYTRREGTLSPEYKEGVLPQMASFSTGVRFPVNVAVGQSFATGHAATLLAKYIGTTANPALSKSIPTTEIENANVSRIKGAVADGKRYFFGTDTSFGLHVTFGLETGGYPDSLSLGYKRKELAFVPISEDTDDNTVGIPSLLATAGLDFKGQQTGGNLEYIQFFATGGPASYLAAKQVIRETIGLRILADSEVSAAVIKRSKEMVSEKTRQRVEQLNERVNALSDEKSIQLLNTPPSFAPKAVEDAFKKSLGGKEPSGSDARKMTRFRILNVDPAENPNLLTRWDLAIEGIEKQ